MAIVNGTFVRDLLGGGRALGVRLTTPLVGDVVSIVGVVADVTPAGESDRPALYVPLDQLAIGGGYLIVRAHGDPPIIPALTNRLRTTAPDLAVDRVRRVAEELEQGRAVTRFSTASRGGVCRNGLAALGNWRVWPRSERRIGAVARARGKAGPRCLTS